MFIPSDYLWTKRVEKLGSVLMTLSAIGWLNQEVRSQHTHHRLLIIASTITRYASTWSRLDMDNPGLVLILNLNISIFRSTTVSLIFTTIFPLSTDLKYDKPLIFHDICHWVQNLLDLSHKPTGVSYCHSIPPRHFSLFRFIKATGIPAVISFLFTHRTSPETQDPLSGTHLLRKI